MAAYMSRSSFGLGNFLVVGTAVWAHLGFSMRDLVHWAFLFWGYQLPMGMILYSITAPLDSLFYVGVHDCLLRNYQAAKNSVVCLQLIFLDRITSNLAFTLVSASYFCAADGNVATAAALKKTAGAFAFIAGMFGYYTMGHLMCQEALFLDFPMGDTSRSFRRKLNNERPVPQQHEKESQA
ncbi:hypothetical protein EAF00_008444 [Botryotinia globosa]|nr:hypothetical protein EAF00_008444 [Botryotinia globosa]